MAMLALLSLTVSVVEQGWAASCVEMADASPVAPHAPESGHGHDGHAPSDAPEGPDRPGSEPAPCPMVAPAGAACGLAALPAIGEGSPVVPDPGMLVPPAIGRVPSFLSFTALFRPPRQ